ncbi:hypothetical protein pb186bvf_012241 [Paramecium bursaria]
MYLFSGPYEIIITQFLLISLECAANILSIILIFWVGLHKALASRVFLYILISQLFYLAPQVIIPYILVNNSKPYINDDIYYPIPRDECKILGYFILSAWMSAALIALFLSQQILKLLQGRNVNPKMESKAIGVMGLIVLITMIPVYYLAEFQNYGFTNTQKQTYSLLCNISVQTHSIQQYIILSILLALNLMFFIITCYKFIQIRRETVKIGVRIKYPLIKLKYMPMMIVCSWNYSLLIKFLDLYVRELNIIENVYFYWVWVALQCIYNLEAFFISSLFYHTYRFHFQISQIPKPLKIIVQGFIKFNIFTWFDKDSDVENPESTLLYEDSESVFIDETTTGVNK